MPPVLRSDSDDDQGRVRAATYPPRPARAFSHHRVGRDEWCAKSLDGHRNTPPVELGGDKKIFSLLKLKKPVNKIVLNRKAARSEGISGWSTKKGFVTPTSCESGSATSRSGATSRGPRRRHRKGWEDVAAAPTRQQRLVTAMFALVIVLASVQIIALVVHPPGEDKYRTRGLAASGQAATLGGAGGGVDGMGDGILKRTTGGFRANFLRSSGDGGGNVLAPVARDVGGRAFSGGEQQHGLSLSNPRAFEMVAADMGNLKDTVEKLDLAFRETMSQQGKDLAAVMNQLGLQPTERRKPPANAAPGAKQSFGKAWSPPFAAVNEASKQRNNGAGQQQQPLGKQAINTGSEIFEKLGGSIAGGVVGSAIPGGLPRETEGRGDAGVKEGGLAGGSVWNAYSHGKWVNGQWVPKVLLDDTTPDLSNLAENQRRVLLVSERRSGGQAVGGVINADPRVFYVGDPCRMGGGPEALSGGACSAAVSRLLACQPTINDVRNLYSFSHIVERSRVLSENEKLRWHVGGTPEENDELLRASLVRECRLSTVVVIKETRLTELAPNLSATALGTEFLHVVRDPRAAIHGLAEAWDVSKSESERAMATDCTDLAARLCKLTEKKLVELTSLGKRRFRVLKYEMVLEAPLPMINSVYNWLQLGKLPQEVTEAVTSMVARRSTTQPSPREAAREGSKNTLDWATRWAAEMPAFRRQQVQHVCEPLLVTLGYDEPSVVDQPSQAITSEEVTDGTNEVPAASAAYQDDAPKKIAGGSASTAASASASASAAAAIAAAATTSPASVVAHAE